MGEVDRFTTKLSRLLGVAVFRLGRLLESSGDLRWVVELLYRMAARLLADRPAVLYRLGRVRERRRKWEGAESAYSAALALGPADREKYLVRRAKVLERAGRWEDALADCQAMPSTGLPYLLVCRLADRLRQIGRLPEAVELFRRPVSDSPTRKYHTMAAECFGEIGDLDGARQAYREAVSLDPGDLNLRTMLGRTASRVSLMPFKFLENCTEPRGLPEQESALAEAVHEFSYILSSSASRVWVAYWLGLLYELHGRFSDAEKAYGVAVERVETSDKSWAYNAKQAWNFRLMYVQHRLSRERAGDRRLNRTLSTRQPVSDVSNVAGYYEVLITNNGLLVEGLALKGSVGSIEVLLDNRTIIRTAGNVTSPQREFKTTIVHSVLDDFPVNSTLTVCVGGRPLITQRRAQAVALSVPGGSGEIMEMLNKGRELTKKGRWADALLSDDSRDEVYLQAYEKARSFFEARLGKKLFLSYGTLLGCYRDGGVIPGDDDFDVSYVSDATDPASFKREGQEILEALLRAGFDARVAIDGRMFHLRVDDSVLDVNPIWFYKGRAWAFNAHDLSRDVFEPAKTMTVSGVRVYIPAKTELFLEENYGSDWRTPRSDFHYHRSKADRAVMRRVRLSPSEVQRLVAFSEDLKMSNGGAGRFHGYGDPADPTFKDDRLEI